MYEIHLKYLHLTVVRVVQSVFWSDSQSLGQSVSNTGLSVSGARWSVAVAGQLVLRARQSVFSAEESVSGVGCAVSWAGWSVSKADDRFPGPHGQSLRFYSRSLRLNSRSQ